MLSRLIRYVDHWGTTPQERELVYPCDLVMTNPDQTFFRGVTIDSPPEVIHRWLCQMKVAPYSYDWLDNLGRRSPRELTPGLEDLQRGQKFMFLFHLIDFDERQLTLRTHNMGSELVVSYLVVENPTRLLVKLCVKYPKPPLNCRALTGP